MRISAITNPQHSGHLILLKNDEQQIEQQIEQLKPIDSHRVTFFTLRGMMFMLSVDFPNIITVWLYDNGSMTDVQRGLDLYFKDVLEFQFVALPLYQPF